MCVRVVCMHVCVCACASACVCVCVNREVPLHGWRAFDGTTQSCFIERWNCPVLESSIFLCLELATKDKALSLFCMR